MALGFLPRRGHGPLVALVCAALVLGACVNNRLPPRTLPLSPAPAANPPAADTTPSAPAKPSKSRWREMLADDAPARESGSPAADLPDFTTAAGEVPGPAGAEHYVNDLGGAVLNKLRDKAAGEDEKIAFFSALLARDLDVNLIARFALGDAWTRSTASQRAAYMAVFGNFIVSTYARRLGGVRVVGFQVVDSRSLGPRDMVVRSRVRQDTGDVVHADWRLRFKSRRYRIIDLSVEGISMALTLRQEFAAVMRAEGGIDGLVETLKARTRDSL